MKTKKSFKFIVGIPTINRADLLNEALLQYFEDFQTTEIFIVDNGNQDIITREKNFAIYRPLENLNVSGSWNLILDYADRVGATHVLMLNDDIYLGCTENEIKLIKNVLSSFEFINSNFNWCAFILSLETFKKIGKFDEALFPNYYNDNDYYMRMKTQGVETINTDMLNPVIYRNSMTIAKDPYLNSKFTEYKNNYIRKWGGEPSFEKFKTPFNK